jgi:hypothetical protein
MVFKTGDVIISKKNHACGANKWIVARTGADVKLKCLQCGKAIFFSPDQVQKMTKSYVQLEEEKDAD